MTDDDTSRGLALLNGHGNRWFAEPTPGTAMIRRGTIEGFAMTQDDFERSVETTSPSS